MRGWLLVCLMSSMAMAAEPDDEERVEYKHRTEIDFSGVDISGELVSPSGALMVTQGGMQDIAFARDSVYRGVVPRPEAFRSEGLLSEHELSLPSTGTCERIICPVTAASPASLAAQPDVQWLGQLGFESALNASTYARPPLHLVWVTDRSGSMRGEKLRNVKAAMHKMVEHLRPDDRVSIVSYGSTVDSVIRMASLENKRELRAAINGIVSQGSTAMEAGLKEGFEQARRDRRGFDGLSRVVLFTDERPNVGATTARSFMGMARAASEDGIGLTTIGVGRDFGVKLASEISAVRGGNLFFYAHADDLGPRIDEDFDTMFVELAYDMHVEVVPADGVTLTGLYGVPGDMVQRTVDGGLRMEIATLFASKRGGGIYVGMSGEPRSAKRGLASLRIGYTGLDGQHPVQSRAFVPQASPPSGLALGQVLVDEFTTLETASLQWYAPEGDRRESLAWVDSLLVRMKRAEAPEAELAFVRSLLGVMSEQIGVADVATGGPRHPITGLPVGFSRHGRDYVQP